MCVSDCGPQILWTRQFMIALGIQEIEENATLIFEDNEACIDLLQNGRPQGVMTRHLNNLSLRMAHLPTTEMRAD